MTPAELQAWVQVVGVTGSIVADLIGRIRAAASSAGATEEQLAAIVAETRRRYDAAITAWEAEARRPIG